MQHNSATYSVKGEDVCISKFLDDGCHLFGVADGHGGVGAARLCKARIEGITVQPKLGDLFATYMTNV